MNEIKGNKIVWTTNSGSPLLLSIHSLVRSFFVCAPSHYSWIYRLTRENLCFCGGPPPRLRPFITPPPFIGRRLPPPYPPRPRLLFRWPPRPPRKPILLDFIISSKLISILSAIFKIVGRLFVAPFSIYAWKNYDFLLRRREITFNNKIWRAVKEMRLICLTDENTMMADYGNAHYINMAEKTSQDARCHRECQNYDPRRKNSARFWWVCVVGQNSNSELIFNGVKFIT